MRRLWVLSVLAVLGGCEPEGYAATWRLTDGTELRFDLGEPASEESHEDRVVYRLESGASMGIQEIPVADRAADEPRTPASVARALAARLELGEREGELLRSACHLSSIDAECLDGAMTVDGRELARHGAVFRAGERLVWLDVSASRSRDEQAAERARAVLGSLQVLDPRDRNDG